MPALVMVLRGYLEAGKLRHCLAIDVAGPLPAPRHGLVGIEGDAHDALTLGLELLGDPLGTLEPPVVGDGGVPRLEGLPAGPILPAVPCDRDDGAWLVHASRVPPPPSGVDPERA